MDIHTDVVQPSPIPFSTLPIATSDAVFFDGVSVHGWKIAATQSINLATGVIVNMPATAPVYRRKGVVEITDYVAPPTP